MSSARLAAPLLALLVVLGCATARLISGDRTLELRPDQGIVVVHVDSDFTVRKLRFGRKYDVASYASPGEYLVMVIVPAGNYHWTVIEIPAGYAYYRFRFNRDSEWSFVVRPGVINYPGQIFLNGSADALKAQGLIYMRNENRSAAVLEKLRATYPKLLAQYPLEYARTDRDDYLEVYQRLVPFGTTNTGNPSE